MSETVFAGRLPRFDENGSLRPPTDWLRPLDEPGENRAAQAARARTEAAKVEAPVVEATPAQLDLRKLEASLTALSGKLDKIERDARAQTVDRILDSQGLANKSRAKPSYKFFVSDDPKHFTEVGEKFLRQKIRCAKKAG